jgi:hypothetical protein
MPMNLESNKIRIDSVEYELQSVSLRWYLNLNDECGMTGDARRDSARYMDTLFKNAVVRPRDVSLQGLDYFEERSDFRTPMRLLSGIESFLRQPTVQSHGAAQSAPA